mmetsp:Transcript_14671/g.38115  ORF Transcript_14671/g.38115 Transcript_14671/m.38115 type:complete len:454 (+) Transcript_14671:1410-2771(+)
MRASAATCPPPETTSASNCLPPCTIVPPPPRNCSCRRAAPAPALPPAPSTKAPSVAARRAAAIAPLVGPMSIAGACFVAATAAWRCAARWWWRRMPARPSVPSTTCTPGGASVSAAAAPPEEAVGIPFSWAPAPEPAMSSAGAMASASAAASAAAPHKPHVFGQCLETMRQPVVPRWQWLTATLHGRPELRRMNPVSSSMHVGSFSSSSSSPSGASSSWPHVCVSESSRKASMLMPLPRSAVRITSTHVQLRQRRYASSKRGAKRRTKGSASSACTVSLIARSVRDSPRLTSLSTSCTSCICVPCQNTSRSSMKSRIGEPSGSERRGGSPTLICLMAYPAVPASERKVMSTKARMGLESRMRAQCLCTHTCSGRTRGGFISAALGSRPSMRGTRYTWSSVSTTHGKQSSRAAAARLASSVRHAAKKVICRKYTITMHSEAGTQKYASAGKSTK